MDDTKLIQLLMAAGNFELNSSDTVDNIIVNDIHNSNITERKEHRLLSSFFIRPLLAVLIIFILTLSIVKIRNTMHKKIEPQELYDYIISQIQDINVKKDIEMALNIYSEDFFNQNNRDELKKNIENLFMNYTEIEYRPVKEKIIVKNGNALIENKIKYYAKAYDKAVKPLFYQGKERIYLKRIRNKWKIVAWVYEEK